MVEQLVLKISNLITHFSFVESLERINKYTFVVLILLLGYLSFNLNGNEEQYMLYAKQFVNPDWILSTQLNEFPGTRLFYQYIVGWFLQYFSFENVLFGFRFLLCLLFAWPLMLIYKRLDMSNVHILLHLPILFLFHQSLFGGSWMMISVEPKGFAYLFVLFAVYYYMVNRFATMIVFLILASYFHILVGGYTFGFAILCLFLFEKPKHNYQFLKYLIIYVISLVPFVIYLKAALINKVDYSPSVDWIYTYFRSPHHTAIFKDLGYFYSKHFFGVLLSFIALFCSIYAYKSIKNPYLKRLSNFVILSLAGVLFIVIVAFFDKEGVLLKYYPFRINTLTTFMLTLVITVFVFSAIKKAYVNIFKLVTVLISILFLIQLAKPTVTNIYVHLKGENGIALNEVRSYIKRNTLKDDVVLSFITDQSLTRKMERDRFVVYKFIPAEMNKIPEWYERVLFKRELAKDFSRIIDKKEHYKIDYLLSKNVISSKFLELQYSNSSYYLYKVKHTF